MSNYQSRNTLLRALAIFLAASAMSNCGQQQGSSAPTSTQPKLNSAGLPVHDTTTVACTVLVTPGDSLPPRIGPIAVGPKGELAWDVPGDSMIVIRSSDGKETRIAGHAGRQGFLGARNMGWRGDTLWVGDIRSSSVQRFGSDGAWRGALDAPEVSSWVPTDSGELLTVAWFGLTLGIPDTVRAILATTPGSRRIDTIAKFSTPPRKLFGRAQGAIIADPLATYTVVGGALDGSRWCALMNLPDGAHFRCVDSRGKQFLDKVVTLDQRPLTDEIFHGVIGAALRPGEHDIALLEKTFTRPQFLPPVFHIFISRDSSAWLLRSDPSEPIQRWLRLKPDGTPQDEWELPRRYAFRDISHDSIWTAESNDLGLQTLTRCVAKH